MARFLVPNERAKKKQAIISILDTFIWLQRQKSSNKNETFKNDYT